MFFELLFLLNVVDCIMWPGSCLSGEFYEPSVMQCLQCPHNVSMTTSSDGFSCTCEEHSIPLDARRCKLCDVTEMVSADGRFCVPRRCQTSGGRVACRKCPRDYITVTQNIDGSPMKEVQCVKCARGFRPHDNRCVRCETCSCAKNEVAVAGKCVPKKYLQDRPKYIENRLHPNALLNIVKLEYLCTEHDVRACRALGRACVRNFYTADKAGPCRLWLEPNTTIKGLPLLTVPGKNGVEIHLERGENSLKLVLSEHTPTGGLKIIRNPAGGYIKCLPASIRIGDDFACDIVNNVTDISPANYNNTYEIYVLRKNNLKALPIMFVKNSRHIQKYMWPSDNFRMFFIIDKYLSVTTNISEVVYLQSLLFELGVSRDTTKTGSLKLKINIEAQYESKSPLTDMITTTVRIHHVMPQAGVIRSLEILGGLFGGIMAVFSMVQWRGAVRRGAPQFVVIPLLTSAIADALYFASLLSTLHALAAEAGTLGLTLPLSKAEETLIKALLYAVILLKVLKVGWVNFNQCRGDVLFIDWSKHNLSSDINEIIEPNDWKLVMVAKEWKNVQTRRQVSPGYTVALTLLVTHLIDPWSSQIPRSQGYKWTVAAVVWWSSYTVLLFARYIQDRIFTSPTKNLPKVCCGVGVSMLVFQEEKYAHYVNGRNEDTLDFRMTPGLLSTCRLFCSTQLREIYAKFSSPGYGDFGQDSNKVLLTKFMAAFFERALDGLNWVACERTVLERLLDVELVDREHSSNTSILLYDTDKTPSCFAVTWWGEEWLLATFDAMLFGSVHITTGEPFIAAFSTLAIWQVMKLARNYFGTRKLLEDISGPSRLKF